MSQIHHNQHPVLEVIHRADNRISQVDHRLSQADLGKVAIRAVTGMHAFRKYHWLTNVVATNSSGNLRGMVMSAKWQAAFVHTNHVGDYLENFGLLAAFVAGIGESASELDAIAESSDSISLKGLRIAAIAGTAAQRALLGIVPAGTHAIYRSLEGWCMMAGLAGGKFQSSATQCVNTLRQADTLVQSTFKTVTDTRSQSRFVWCLIDTVLSPGSSK